MKYKSLTKEKIQRRLRGIMVRMTHRSRLYPYFYPSLWHYLFNKVKSNGEIDLSEVYYAARPNSGAGIGHQIQNWVAGLKYAQDFGCHFAHLHFSTKKWEDFLGFGQGYKTVEELIRAGYKIRRLPLFDDGNNKEKELCKQIIRSYSGQKVVIIAEQDQFYRHQADLIPELQRMFYSAPIRMTEHLRYDSSCFNIAIHVRRGDIMVDVTNSNLTMRILSNDYFEKVLSQVMEQFTAKSDKPLHIWFFSQGKPEDYPEFGKYENLHWCFDMDAQESFLHMVYADVLITSKSSFSYNPALLNRGVKVCPKDFWHGYPKQNDWVMVENNGKVNW